MALAAKQDNCMQKSRAPGEVVTMPKGSQLAGRPGVDRSVKQTFLQYTERATRILMTSKESASKAYGQARRQAVQGYSRLARKTQDLGRRTQDGARRVRREHPVQLLAIIAGAAFVAGFAIRMWRSRAS